MKPRILPPAFGALAPPAAFQLTLFQRLLQRLLQRRIQVLVDAGAQRGENGIGSAVVLSAMIIGSPAAARMEATRPSSGSFQPLISTSTTSGRMRSRRSRKLLTVAEILLFDDDAERQIGEAWPAPGPRVPGFRSPVRWSADTCDSLLLRPLQLCAAAGRGAGAGGAGVGRRRRPRARRHRHRHELQSAGRRRLPGLPCCCWINCFDRHGLRRRLHRHRSGLVHTRLCAADVGCSWS